MGIACDMFLLSSFKTDIPRRHPCDGSSESDLARVLGLITRWRLPRGSLRVSNYTREGATHVPGQIDSRNVESLMIRRVPDGAPCFRTDCDEDHVTEYRQLAKYRLLPGRVTLFSPESQELYPSRAVAPVNPPMIQFVSLEKVRVRIRSYRKNIYTSLYLLSSFGSGEYRFRPDAFDTGQFRVGIKPPFDFLLFALLFLLRFPVNRRSAYP